MTIRRSPCRAAAPPRRFALWVAVLAAVLSALGGPPGAAQDDGSVTITFDDGAGIDGRIVEISDASIRLETPLMGTVTVPKDGTVCRGSSCPDDMRPAQSGDGEWEPPAPVAEEDAPPGDAPVTLTSVDGATSVTGNLVRVTGLEYVVATEFGELRVDIARATCAGTGCPAAPTDRADPAPPEPAPAAAAPDPPISDPAASDGPVRSEPVAGDPAAGGAVSLTDGLVVIDGILTGVDGDDYVVDVVGVGSVRVPLDYRCSGAGCPDG